jgi:hypothetical protein
LAFAQNAKPPSAEEIKMPAYLDLFTPETWQAFLNKGRNVSGFREWGRQIAARIKRDDVFVCYLVGLSRWVGVLKVLSDVYEDSTPYFVETDDPFVLRFNVEPVVTLLPIRGIPIKAIWDKLSMCRGIQPSAGFTYKVGLSRSLKELSEADASTLIGLLKQQSTPNGNDYPLTAQERKRLEGKRTVATEAGPAPVEIPDEDEAEAVGSAPERRRSLSVQANLAKIGIQLGFKVWVAASDRAAVLDILKQEGKDNFLSKLPLNADENTVDTVERIDVLWVRGRTIARAFEVEDKTAVYSGILRMADLIALQPQFQIKLHIVAPADRQGKVRDEILRPVFAYMEGGPLAKICTYLSYDAVEELVTKKDLHFLRDTIIEEYEEIFE